MWSARSWRASRYLASLHADHRRIAHGLVLGAVFVLLGRVAGAVKEMTIAWRYGISGTVDAYQLASTLVGWLPSTLISVTATVLVPTLVGTRSADPMSRARFLGEINGWALALGFGLMAIGGLAWPLVVGLLSSGLSEATRQLAIDMSIQLLPVSLFSLLVGLFSARLQARERHVNTLLEAVPALTLCFMLVSWPAGVASAPLVIGTVLGLSLHAALLGGLATKADGHLGSPKVGISSPYWTDIWRGMRILFVGHLAMSFIGPIDQFTAAHFGDRAIATLGYANRLIALLLGLGALSIARAALPVFADAFAAAGAKRAGSRAMKWAWLMFAAGVIAAGIAWMVMDWGIAVLFERGAFTPEDTALVANLARWGLLQLPFYFGSMVLVQVLAACGDFRPIAASALVNLIVKVALNVLAVQWIGLSGIMVATAGMYAFSFLYLLRAVQRDLGRAEARA